MPPGARDYHEKDSRERLAVVLIVHVLTCEDGDVGLPPCASVSHVHSKACSKEWSSEVAKIGATMQPPRFVISRLQLLKRVISRYIIFALNLRIA